MQCRKDGTIRRAKSKRQNAEMTTTHLNSSTAQLRTEATTCDFWSRTYVGIFWSRRRTIKVAQAVLLVIRHLRRPENNDEFLLLMIPRPTI